MDARTNPWLKGVRTALIVFWYVLLVLVDLNSYGRGQPTYVSQIGSVVALYFVFPIVLWSATLLVEILLVAVFNRTRKSVQ